MNWLLAAFWIIATVLMAWAQGWLLPAIRRTPDNTPEATRQSFALHWLLGAVWFLPALVVMYFYRHWEPLVIAVAIRFVFFDPVLNLAEGRQGVPIFYVGETAATDKLLRLVAKFLRLQPSVLSAILKGLVLAGVIIWQV